MTESPDDASIPLSSDEVVDACIYIDRARSESSSDRHTRSEQEWTSRNSELCHAFYSRACEASQKHHLKFKRWRKVHHALGLPSVILPLVAATLQPYLVDTGNSHYPMVLVALMLASAIVSATLAFVDPSKKREAHDQASARYDELSVHIETVLANVLITEFKLRLINLNNSSPSL